MELSQEEIHNNIEYQQYLQLQYEIEQFIHHNDDDDTSSYIYYDDYDEDILSDNEYNSEFIYDIEDDIYALEKQNNEINNDNFDNQE